jgi:hypothetical protein
MHEGVVQLYPGFMQGCLGSCHDKVGHLLGPQPYNGGLDCIHPGKTGKGGRVGHFQNLCGKGLVFTNCTDYIVDIRIRFGSEFQHIQGDRVENGKVNRLSRQCLSYVNGYGHVFPFAYLLICCFLLRAYSVDKGIAQYNYLIKSFSVKAGKQFVADICQHYALSENIFRGRLIAPER